MKASRIQVRAGHLLLCILCLSSVAAWQMMRRSVAAATTTTFLRNPNFRSCPVSVAAVPRRRYRSSFDHKTPGTNDSAIDKVCTISEMETMLGTLYYLHVDEHVEETGYYACGRSKAFQRATEICNKEGYSLSTVTPDGNVMIFKRQKK